MYVFLFYDTYQMRGYKRILKHRLTFGSVAACTIAVRHEGAECGAYPGLLKST